MHFLAEFHVLIYAIENANIMGWKDLWLESDSQVVGLDFDNENMTVPWQIGLHPFG